MAPYKAIILAVDADRAG